MILHVYNASDLHSLVVKKPMFFFRATLCISAACGCVGWLRGTVVERWSLTGELSLSCARPAVDR